MGYDRTSGSCVARYYDPRTSVWQSADPILGKYLPSRYDEDINLAGLGGIYNSQNLGLYGYAGLNPMVLVDPDGKELTTFEAKGLTSNDPVLKSRTYYADTKVAKGMAKFANDAYKKFGVTVNNTFRLEDSSKIKTKNTKSKGLSRHQGGFAIDLNGVGGLSPQQLKELNTLAAENGLAPLMDQAKDLPHFDADPTMHGYKSLNEAVDVNRKDYQNKTQPKAMNSGRHPLGDYVTVNENLA